MQRTLSIQYLGTFHFTQLHCMEGKNNIDVPGYFKGYLIFDKNWYNCCGNILSYCYNELTGERWASCDGGEFPWPDLIDAEGPKEQVNLGELLAITAGCTMPKSVIDRVKRTCPHYIIPEGLEIYDDMY